MSVSFYIVVGGMGKGPDAPRAQILHEPLVTEIDGETFEENALEVNMHSAGAESVARTLGFRIDFANGGEITDLAAFLRECDSTLALLRDMPELDACDERGHVMGPDNPVRRVMAHLGATEGANTGARVIQCPRPDGYLLRNVARLRMLAERAVAEKGRLVYA